MIQLRKEEKVLQGSSENDHGFVIIGFFYTWIKGME